MQKTYKELEQAIQEFPSQFSWEPQLVNDDALPRNCQNIAICGMGGSALAANVLLSNPKVPNIRIHRDYWHNWLQDMDLIIVSSFSGNTEEMIDVYEHAKIANVPVAVATNGGKLLDLVIQDGNPYIQLADALQPRYAIGYSYVALSKLIDAPLSEKTGQELASICTDAETMQSLAKETVGKQIVYYATPQNFSIAYVWKILTNESAKQMAWVNKFPEFNHNELNGYFTSDQFNLSENLAVVILTSDNEHERNRRRIDIIKQQLTDRDISVIEIEIVGDKLLDRVVYGWQAGMYFTLELARQNDVDPKEVKMIEDLKDQLNK